MRNEIYEMKREISKIIYSDDCMNFFNSRVDLILMYDNCTDFFYSSVDIMNV